MAALSAPVVQYGRRKGHSRTQSAVNQSETIMQKVDLRQVAVLPKAEWERMVNSTKALEIESERIFEQRQEREALHLRSKEVVKNWTNTIAGARQKRLESKKLREEKEEEEKKQIDLEEAKFQEEKRREVIEKARLKQYYQNDKVKKFHSALLLTEVLKERDLQIELKNKVAMFNKNKEMDLQHELEQSIIEDQKKAQKRLSERRNNAKELLKQIEGQKHRAELEKFYSQKEGEEIQRLTQKNEAEMRQFAKLKTEEKQELKKAHLAHLKEQDFIRALGKQKEEENDKMLRRYIHAKKEMGNLRKAKEEELNRLVEERRDRISDILSAWYKQKEDDEEQRTAKAIADLEAKHTKEAQEKEAKIKAELKTITEHRLAARRKKEEEEKEEKIKALQALYSVKESDRLFFQEQNEKMRRVDEEHKAVQEIQVQQMAEKLAMSEAEKEIDMQYSKQNDLFLTKEEEQFQEYAKHVIDNVTKAGRNPYPLKKAAQIGTGGGHGPVFCDRAGIRPSYLAQDTSGNQLPSYQNETTQEIKGLHDTRDIQHGKRKLGFTW
ncbi:hypothetical protein GDO86_016891 [Hymenochirus boettgeri]|uniref:Trichohyalin-plectin-homology domain-containing protein n=1 Tax=Hymenochirus boettgeri TaxID=247094 RepID=A0A8T2IKA0_9PIPI|nr:hypothetical protein GDO86_016891 [Hymenochirus boettgeri]